MIQSSKAITTGLTTVGSYWSQTRTVVSKMMNSHSVRNNSIRIRKWAGNPVIAKMRPVRCRMMDPAMRIIPGGTGRGEMSPGII